MALHIELNVNRRRFGQSDYRIDGFDRLSQRKRGFTGKKWNWDVQQAFAEYVAGIIRDECATAIEDERFRNKWPPLSVTYVRYKQRHRLSMKMWKATGLLEQSIVARKRLGYWYVGVDPSKRYRNGMKVIDIARCMEYGTSRMPARPLFRPIFEDIRKNLGSYWDDFLESEGIDRAELEQRRSLLDRIPFIRNLRNRQGGEELDESLAIADLEPVIRNNPYDRTGR